MYNNIIKFNFENIYLISYGKSELIVSLFRRLLKNPKNLQFLSGNSFIVNPSILIDTTIESRILAEYLGILSFRSLSDYILYGITSLDINNLPIWIPEEVIYTNPLITVKDNKLIFTEENK